MELSREIRENDIRIVCISGVPPFAVSAARQNCKRLKQEFPNLKVVVGIWHANAQPTDIANRLSSSAPDSVCTRFTEAVSRITTLLESEESVKRRTESQTKKAIPPSPVTLAELPEPDAGEAFSAISRQAAKLLNVPISLVSLIDSDPEFWKLHGGLPPDLVNGEALRESSLCNQGIRMDDVLVLEDVAKETRCANDPFLQSRGIRFFVSVPLRTSEGHVVGALCITDTQPHEVTERARELLRNLAQRLVRKVEANKPALAA